MNILYTELEKTGIFSNLFIDYCSGANSLRSYIVDFPSAAAIQQRLTNFQFSYLDRQVLADELTRQYTGLLTHDSVSANVALLRNSNCFTVATGHQLCLFTGPAYFIYKIISCIKICRELKEQNPAFDFVPVYWLASEDHDLEEINHTFFYGRKVEWQMNGKGKAGELPLDGIKESLDELKKILGDKAFAGDIMKLFERALADSRNLSEFIRRIVNALFGKYGLIILDGNTHALKKLFRAEMAADVKEQLAGKAVNVSAEQLKALGYSAQVNPRDINLFYTDKNLRERIEKQGDGYVVLNTSLRFNEKELLELIGSEPERFSPNVVLRPVYQQKILPNLIYCGGPGEIAYWLEYKQMFDSYKIHFPFLVPRNFNVVLDKTVLTKWKELGFDQNDFFRAEDELIKELVKRNTGEIKLEEERLSISQVYDSLLKKAEETDKGLLLFVNAEKQKALNSIAAAESKMNRALKQRNDTAINQLRTLRNKVMPEGTLQERKENFFAFANNNGLKFLDELVESLPSPLASHAVTFSIPE